MAKSIIVTGRIDPKYKEFLNFLGIDVSEVFRLMADAVITTLLPDSFFDEEKLKQRILENIKQQVEQISNEIEEHRMRIEELKMKIRECENNIKEREAKIKELESRKGKLLSIVNKRKEEIAEIAEYTNYLRYKYELIKDDLNKYFKSSNLSTMPRKTVYSILETIAEKNKTSMFFVVRVFKQHYNVDLNVEEGIRDADLSGDLE
jgi:antitoxin component of RelBE/YafQ-DinJ toxin-antitoxin module